MSELRDLYQTVILDHNKAPRNNRAPEDANRFAEGHNPLCGDHVTVHLALEDSLVQDVGFEGRGCAISTASASLMTEAIKGKSAEDVMALFDGFHALLTAPADEDPDTSDLGKLQVFSGVREYPMRVKCATLCWHTMRAALEHPEQSVTTE